MYIQILEKSAALNLQNIRLKMHKTQLILRIILTLRHMKSVLRSQELILRICGGQNIILFPVWKPVHMFGFNMESKVLHSLIVLWTVRTLYPCSFIWIFFTVVLMLFEILSFFNYFTTKPARLVDILWKMRFFMFSQPAFD